MRLKAYSIEFAGHYPVGAVAVVFAYTQERAKNIFLLQLSKEEPHLVADNIRADIKLVQLDNEVSGCHILLNGDY